MAERRATCRRSVRCEANEAASSWKVRDEHFDGDVGDGFNVGAECDAGGLVAVAAVILAAGDSRRLGEPKQLIELGGERLLERSVRTCREAGLHPVFVVLGARAAEISAQCDLRDAEVVRCERWVEGMGQAVAAGVAAVAERNAASAIVMTCDMPFVTPAHLMALGRKRTEVCASAYAGRHGVPAHFPRSAFADLMRLQGDAGARELLTKAKGVELGDDALDIDTPEDLVRARERFAGQKRRRRGARQ